MEETTAVVYATDDEEDVLKVRALLEREGIACALIMRSDNYLFGPGILNEGLPLLAGKYAIQVHPEDEERSLTLIEGWQSLPASEASTRAPEVPQPSAETPGASSEAERTLPPRPARLLESIVFVAIFLAAEFALSWALYLLGFRFRLRATVDIVVRITAFFIVAAVIKERLHRPAMDPASITPAPLGTYAVTVFGSIGIFLLMPPIDGFLANAFPFYERSIQITHRLYDSNDVVGTLLRSSFVAPVLEETLFRGVIFAGLASRYRLSTALVLSSLIFAAYHHNAAQVIGPLLSGILFAAAYQRSASLLPCFLGHALNNFIWFLSLFYRSIANSERSLFDLDQAFDIPRIIMGVIILASSVAVLLRSRRKKTTDPANMTELRSGPASSDKPLKPTALD